MAARMVCTIQWRGSTYRRHACRGGVEEVTQRMGEWITEQMAVLQNDEAFVISVRRCDEPHSVDADAIRKELAEAQGSGDAGAWLFLHRMERLVNGDA